MQQKAQHLKDHKDSSSASSGKKDFFVAGLTGQTGAAAAASSLAAEHHHAGVSAALGSPNTPGGGQGVQVKDEPDFIETHCHWIGCDREFDTQDQLVKVSIYLCEGMKSYTTRTTTVV